METVLYIAIYLAALVIFGDAVVRLNHIERRGCHFERFCAVCSAVGSFGVLAGGGCRDNRLVFSLLMILAGTVGSIVLDRRDAIMDTIKRVWAMKETDNGFIEGWTGI